MNVTGPTMQNGGRLVWAFWEDPITAAWELLAGPDAPQHVHVDGIELPPWLTSGLGVAVDPEAPHTLALVSGSKGPLVWCGARAMVAEVQSHAERLLRHATRLDGSALANHRRAGQEELLAEDVPQGAYVSTARHEAVLQGRLRTGPGPILTWTTVQSGAGPTEYHRFASARGDYSVVMVEAPGGRTVGPWLGDAPPRTGMLARPRLARLWRSVDTWRYGMAFAPSL